MALKYDTTISPAVVSYKIINSGPPFFERLLRMIEESRECIHLQFYIFSNDQTGMAVQEALVKASVRGVKISIVLDGIGSRQLPEEFLAVFSNAGIQVRFFSRLRFSLPFRMGRRLHLKLMVVDMGSALVGGINIADRYHGNGQNPPWLDFAVYLEGPICMKLHNTALNILNKRNFRKIGLLEKAQQKVKPLLNDFFRNKLEIRKSYIREIRKARHSLILFASYFLPDHRLLNQLLKSADRGVEVKLVLPHISDAPFYSTAVKHLYPRLLEKGIRIFEYAPTTFHAKVAVADRKWLTIGSYNLNDLSNLLSIELNIEFNDPETASAFHEKLESIIDEGCIEIEKSTFVNPTFLSRWKWHLFHSGILHSIRILHWLTRKEARNYLE